MFLASTIALIALAAPPKQEWVEWYGSIEVAPSGELIAFIPPVPGQSDDTCKMVVLVDNGTGAPIVVEIDCQSLGGCLKLKGRCSKKIANTTPGGASIIDCRCVKGNS